VRETNLSARDLLERFRNDFGKNAEPIRKKSPMCEEFASGEFAHENTLIAISFSI